MNPPPLLELNGTIESFRKQMEDIAVPVKDIWFPTRGELITWQGSDKRYFVRWTGPDQFEAGVRQETMAAARLAPHWYCQIDAQHERLRISFHQGFPRVTRNLIIGFTICLAVWGVFADTDWRVVWFGTCVTLGLTISVAWTWGLRALQLERTHFEETLRGTK